ncbi:MGMT family protein [Pedobacter alpinus]|uniref:MGMT family protein n=1 Tax=Pedobacter alpinus TaxID=1590643 RepID=A0ABW5TUC8_9SPHI
MDRASFFEQVYQVVRLIPEGKVTSYGAIAAYLGIKGSSRMVGYAMNGASLILPQIPAHRVVNRNGLLTGKFHFESPTKMEELLAAEGVIVKNDKIQNFKDHYWEPSLELDLEK